MEVRRPERRPSVGIRTLELRRSSSGFGFTLSGQEPCVLSGVIKGSPAHEVGLKPGDSVIAVNGHNVSKATHEQVVAMIANSNGIIKIQIAERYCSSSDEEEFQGRSMTGEMKQRSHRSSLNPNFKPNPIPQHRSKSATNVLVHQQHNIKENVNKSGQPENFEEIRSKFGYAHGRKVIRDVMSDDEDYETKVSKKPIHIRGNSADSTFDHRSDFSQLEIPGPLTEAYRLDTGKSKGRHVELGKSEELHLTEHEINSFLHPTMNELRKSMKQKNSEHFRELILGSRSKFVVGYLGTIEMPQKITNKNPLEDSLSDDLAAIRSCIMRLRVKQKVHTLVMLCICKDKIVLINHHGIQLAEYLEEQIEFCGKCTDDMRFFGLVTSRHSEDEKEEVISSSCHVFMTESVLDPNERQSRANAFQLKPYDTENELFKEFPETAEPIIDVIMKTFNKKSQLSEMSTEATRNVSEGLSSGSSNGDSGFSGVAVTGVVENSLSKTELQQELNLQSAGNSEIEAIFDENFISDQLEAQNSAENIRYSMQKFLKSKQRQIKRVSEQHFKNQVHEHTQFSAKSLEDLREGSVDEIASGAEEHKTLSGQRFSSSLANYLCSSDSNISQLSASECLTHKGHRLNPNQIKAHRHILRPGEQYPSSEPGVLKSDRSSSHVPHFQLVNPECLQYQIQSARPYSSQSLRSGSLASHPEEDESNEADSKDEPHDIESRKRWPQPCNEKCSNFSFNNESVQAKTDQTNHGKINTDDTTIADEAKSVDSERVIDVGRVGSWATDFSRLLNDPVGIQTFAEFLKKEFSAENINFWVACEKYRRLSTSKETGKSLESRKHTLAMEIVDKHLASGCPDPVNVDSHARQAAMDGMANLPPDLFNLAQKQIYNLMKFDSYSRFLKSELYKTSLMAEMSESPLPFENQLDSELQLDQESQKSQKQTTSSEDVPPAKPKKDSGQEVGSRRRSILPWSNFRSKDRSKSKERPASAAALSEFIESKSSKSLKKDDRAASSLDVSKSSAGSGVSSIGLDDSVSVGGETNSSNCSLARVILPDKATTVVQTKAGENIRAMVARLLEKRGLRYTSFDVFLSDGEKPLDLTEDSTVLACTEVRVEPRVLFRLELPSKKSIGVKAKPQKVIRDVLGPILNQYGWDLDTLEVFKDHKNSYMKNNQIDLNSTVSSIDNSRLVVASLMNQQRSKRAYSFTAEEEDHRSTASSSRGSLEGFKLNPRRTVSATDDEKLAMPPPVSIPPKKAANFSKQLFNSKSNITDDLYEGLKIVQRGRLDDQRGTEINFEMPDFLKRNRNSQDKENYPSMPAFPSRLSEPLLPPGNRPSSRLRRETVLPPRGLPEFPNMPNLGNLNSPNRQSHYYSQISNSESEHEYHQPYSLLNFRRDSFILSHGADESTFSHEGVIPNYSDAERFFNSSSGYFNNSRLSFGFQTGAERPQIGLPITPGSQQPEQMYETLSHYKPRLMTGPLTKEPPPLPPKPRLSTVKQNFISVSEVDMQQSRMPTFGSEVSVPIRSNNLTRGNQTRDDRSCSVSFV